MHFVRTWTWTFTLLLGFVTLKSLHSSFFFSKKEDPNSPYGRPNVAAPSSSQAKEKKSSSPFKNNPKFLIDGPKRYEFLYSVKYPFQFHTKGISLVPGYTLMESTTVTTSNSELFLLPPDSIKGALQSEWPFLGKDLQVDLTLKYGTFTSNPGPTTTKVSSSLPLIHEYGMAFWWSTHRFNTSTSSTSNHLAMDISAFQGVVISILPISTTTTSSSTTKTIRSSSEEVKPSQGQDSEVKILVQVTSNLLSASYPKTSETLVTLGECVTPFRNLLPHSTLRMVYNHGLLVVETQWNALSRPCMSEHVDFIDLPSYFTLSAQNHQSARSTTLQLIDLAVYTLNPPSKKKPTPKPSYVKPPPSSSSSSSSSTKQVRNVDPNQPEVQTNSHIKEEAINNKQDTKHMEAMAEIKKSLDSITNTLNTLLTKSKALDEWVPLIHQFQRSMEMTLKEHSEQRAHVERKIDEVLHALPHQIESQVSSVFQEHSQRTSEMLIENHSGLSTRLIVWVVLIQCVFISLYFLVKQRFQKSSKKYL